MIRLLFVVALTQALPHYSAYPTAGHDQMEGTKSVSTSFSVHEGKNEAGAIVPPQPIPSFPQPIAVDIIDSNTGQKLNTYNMVRLIPHGYQQPGIQPYSLQYLAFDGYPTPYGWHHFCEMLREKKENDEVARFY
uniref:Secreted protein n=1 Tax=Haemonchus contortus TaxID=6289 RepID=A0A7I4YSS8_HAECO